MATFIVRVELHDSNNYEELHAAMKEQGFSRKIKGHKKWYKLPTATYRMETDELDKKEVLAKAKDAAASVDKNYGILVIKSAGTTWVGLEPLS